MAIPLFLKIEFAMEPLFIQVDSNLCGTAIKSSHASSHAKNGIDLFLQQSKGVRHTWGKFYFNLITVCNDAAKSCPSIWPDISKREHWSFEDPLVREGTNEEKLGKFRQVRDQIEAHIKAWITNSQ